MSTSGHNESPDSSYPPSPTTTRKPSFPPSHSGLTDTERTPLISGSGARNRRPEPVDTSKQTTRLSRNHSRHGKCYSISLAVQILGGGHTIRPLFATRILANSIMTGSLRGPRHHSRAGSWGARLSNALSTDRHASMRESKTLGPDERVWYDQFTSTDWVHDSVQDAYRVKALRSRTDLRGRIKAFFDGGQGWVLSALVGFITAVIAYVVDVSEAPVYDWKDGYCHDGFFLSEKVILVFYLSRMFRYPPAILCNDLVLNHVHFHHYAPPWLCQAPRAHFNMGAEFV